VGHDLTGLTAVVTGGNGGIGLGMAAGLAKSGANIAVWGTQRRAQRVGRRSGRFAGREGHRRPVRHR
jgi:NAD(P)-dependent dehydrogenase (short-subunit alcohol dehydrogenase family)